MYCTAIPKTESYLFPVLWRHVGSQHFLPTEVSDCHEQRLRLRPGQPLHVSFRSQRYQGTRSGWLQIWKYSSWNSWNARHIFGQLPEAAAEGPIEHTNVPVVLPYVFFSSTFAKQIGPVSCT